jgi:hypothetical protein
MSAHDTDIWPNGTWLSACNPLLRRAGPRAHSGNSRSAALELARRACPAACSWRAPGPLGRGSRRRRAPPGWPPSRPREVVHRRQPGADIDQLPYARLVHQIANRPPHESAVNARLLTDIRQIGRNLLGGLPVGRIIVLSAEEVIVNACGTRNIRPECRAPVIAVRSLRPVRGGRRAPRTLWGLGAVWGTSPLIRSWLPSPLSPRPLGVIGESRGSCGH